jgi:internalin A
MVIIMDELFKPPNKRACYKSPTISDLIEYARLKRSVLLDLAWKSLKIVPESLCYLTWLKDLRLSGNLLTELPESIRQLNKLTHLDLSRNQFTVAPKNVEHLIHLLELNLSNNKLVLLPESIGHLTHLRRLELFSNQLEALPEAIGDLINLFELNLSNNKLVLLPESIGHLTHLRRLEVYFNKLIRLPVATGQLSNLQVFYLSHNKLTELPDSIGKLSELERLDLSYNQLPKLPETIGQLSRLNELNLSNNNLTRLPETINHLTQLVRLDLSNNNLIELPESLRNLKNLKELDLDGNKELSMPVEILATHKPSEILEYYFRIRTARRPLNEAKLILVGRGGVGKTSIVNRLIHNRFKRDEEKTEGIRITEWKLRINAEDVRLNIWDFGGQEIMHATHQFFLTQRSLYLLVLNGREGGEDADAEYWLKLIESFGGESPVIVVLNKINEHSFDINRRALQQKYPSIRNLIKTDCEDGTGIIELRKAIERETDNLDHLRDAFPASWFEIKDKLAYMKKNYLSFEEYCRFCEEHGEADKLAQGALASYLHNVGIILNYREDLRLHDTHVLNPHWVTNGIYKILNSKILEVQKGEINLHQLSEILDVAEYPTGMRRFIFDLMKKFELCFSFPDEETHYLIPELLDKQEPEEVSDFKPEECLNFQYHYPVLPEGLLPRFIVRTHRLSEGLPRWRTGVILKFEGNHALIKADLQDKKVFVSVTGLQAGRRRLLAIIRSDFDRIHCDIRNLQPQEMVPLPSYPNLVIPYKKLDVMEQHDVRQFIEVIGDRLIELSVYDLLNGVDFESRRERAINEYKQPVRLFYSYSHKDETLRNELETHLKILQRLELIESWHDRNIGAGEDWRQKIDENLERANIILLLISADFIASDYCYEKEMKRALEKHEKKEVRVIPVIIRDVNWTHAPFSKLQALPENGLPIVKWPDRDSAWRNVSEQIEKVIDEMQIEESDN